MSTVYWAGCTNRKPLTGHGWCEGNNPKAVPRCHSHCQVPMQSLMSTLGYRMGGVVDCAAATRVDGDVTQVVDHTAVIFGCQTTSGW